MNKELTVKLDECTYGFYKEIADCVQRPIEDVLSDTLLKCAEIIMRESYAHD